MNENLKKINTETDDVEEILTEPTSTPDIKSKKDLSDLEDVNKISVLELTPKDYDYHNFFELIRCIYQEIETFNADKKNTYRRIKSIDQHTNRLNNILISVNNNLYSKNLIELYKNDLISREFFEKELWESIHVEIEEEDWDDELPKGI